MGFVLILTWKTASAIIPELRFGDLVMTAIARSTQKAAQTCLIWCVIGMLCVHPVHAATAQQSCRCESPLSVARSMPTGSCCSDDLAENDDDMHSTACCTVASEPDSIVGPVQVCSCQGTHGDCQCVDCHCADQGTPTPGPAIPGPTENQTLTVSIPNPCHGLLLKGEPATPHCNPSTVACVVLSAQQLCALLSRFSC